MALNFVGYSSTDADPNILIAHPQVNKITYRTDAMVEFVTRTATTPQVPLPNNTKAEKNEVVNNCLKDVPPNITNYVLFVHDFYEPTYNNESKNIDGLQRNGVQISRYFEFFHANIFILTSRENLPHLISVNLTNVSRVVWAVL